MWRKGTVGKYRWEAKVYDEGSHFGIGDGRISKLIIILGKKWVFNYDRGFDFADCSVDILFKVLDNIFAERKRK